MDWWRKYHVILSKGVQPKSGWEGWIELIKLKLKHVQIREIGVGDELI